MTKKFRHSCNVHEDFQTVVTIQPHDSLRTKISKTILRFVTISYNNPKTKLIVKSDAGIEKERKKHIQGRDHVYIHALSEFRWYWEFYMAFTYLIFFLVAPWKICLVTRHKPLQPERMDWKFLILDCIFFFDIILSFNTGTYIPIYKITVIESRTVIRNYLTGFFFIDFFSSFPFEFISLVCFPNHLKLFVYLQMVPFLKYFRFSSFLSYISRCLRSYIRKPGSIRNYRVALTFVLAMHTIACIFHLAPVNEYNVTLNASENFYVDGKLYSLHDTVPLYINGILYILASFSSAGYGRNQPEGTVDLYLCLGVMLFVNLLRVYIIVYIMEQILSHTVRTNQNLEMMNQLQEYMRIKKIPLPTQKRLVQYYDYRFQKKYFKELFSMQLLSEHLCAEIILSSCKTLVNSELFQGVPKNAVGLILGRLHYEVYLPNDVVVKAGSIGDCMYFISSGTVAVYTPTGREICHLDDGEFFGEVALILKDSKRVATIVALEMTEVFRLDRNDFQDVIASNAELYQKLESLASERINKTIIQEELHRVERERLINKEM